MRLSLRCLLPALCLLVLAGCGTLSGASQPSDPSAVESPSPGVTADADPSPGQSGESGEIRPSDAPISSDGPDTSEAPSDGPDTSETPSDGPDTSEAPSDDPDTSEAPSDDPDTSEAPSDGPDTSEAPSNGPDTSEAPSDGPDPSETPSGDPVESDSPVTAPSHTPDAEEDPAYTGSVEVDPGEGLEDESSALQQSPPAIPLQLKPTAPGTQEKRCDSAVIDYSNAADGYVMVKYLTACSERLKAQVKCAGVTYTYNLTPQEWAVFPLSEGSGDYTVAVYRNVADSKYTTVLSVGFSAALTDEFGPFLYPNQYVDFSAAPGAVSKAAQLTAGISDPLEKVAAVYDFVVTSLTYDTAKAATVQSGYLPDLDAVLAAKKGICFDYAALMAGMLRSQGIPCKLVVGYAGTAYHAWISVWTEESGWIDGAIFFDGRAWHRMDPTFASSSGSSSSILQYIGDGKNYTAKYLY